VGTLRRDRRENAERPWGKELSPLPWWPGQPVPPLAWGTPEDQEAPVLLLLDRRAAAGAETTRALVSLLDHGEQERVQRLRRPEDQDRYRLGRAALRQVLGAWLDRDPAALRFRYGPHGKPALDGVVDAAPHFNVAHSGDLILLAFHATSPVGVDVEQHRPHLAWEPLARRVLPPGECQLLEQLPPERRRDAFLAAWCRLEARLKARGEGLAGLERLQAEALSGQAPAAERTWAVALPTSYRAAVAVAAAP
jgi:4'-phosphopantetheinyl transferase